MNVLDGSGSGDDGARLRDDTAGSAIEILRSQNRPSRQMTFPSEQMLPMTAEI